MAQTLLAGADTLSITGSLTPRLGFDPLGFAAIHRTVRVPQILVVRADDPAPDFAAWFAASRREPPAIGTPGHGQLAHLLVEQLSRAADSRWTHVPYRGGALAVNDLLGGQLQGVMINIGAVTDHVRSGRLRGLFVSPEARAAALPEVPTLREVGFAGLSAVGWHGLVAPGGTDPAIIARLNAASRAAVKRPEVAERLAALGVEPTDEPPEVLQAAIRDDAARYAEIIRRLGITAPDHPRLISAPITAPDLRRGRGKARRQFRQQRAPRHIRHPGPGSDLGAAAAAAAAQPGLRVQHAEPGAGAGRHAARPARSPSAKDCASPFPGT
jgi:tripartite-type tricarboxylate transporter receptor subunit TctC